MPITVAKSSGFCQGVKKAVDVAMNMSEPVAVYGELIHNESVLEKLREKGVECINDLSEINGRKLIIRSHGVGKDVYDYLEKKNLDYVYFNFVFFNKNNKNLHEN